MPLWKDWCDSITVRVVWSARALQHPLLCDGGNACLQVFGGMGYMCDVGIEAVVCDLNTLRLINGSPSELHVAVSAFAATEAWI